MRPMDELKIGNNIFIESYKHDGSFHRAWSKAYVIDAQDDFAVAVTDHTWVVESDGRRWLTREPAVCFFYYHRWFNVISMMRKTGIYYYCNLASPSIFDGEAMKNIDYDLDVKVFPDGQYTILDENEYEAHSREMQYPQDIKQRIEEEMDALLLKIQNGEEPFSGEYVNDYLLKYFAMTGNNDNQ